MSILTIRTDAGICKLDFTTDRTQVLLEQGTAVVAPCMFPEGAYSVILFITGGIYRVDSLVPEGRSFLTEGREFHLYAGKERIASGKVLCAPGSMKEEGPAQKKQSPPSSLIAEMAIKLHKAQESRRFTEDWYAVRFQTLKKWADKLPEESCQEFYSILANATTGPYEPPTVDRQLAMLRHKLREAERALAKELMKSQGG